MLDVVLRDFFQGVGIGFVMFLMALPAALIVRLTCKVPASWGKALQALVLFILAYGLLRTFVGGDMMGFTNILVIPSAIYLLCAYAVSAKANWLWHGVGLLTLPVGFMLAMVASVLIRVA